MKILVILLKRIGDALVALPVCGSLRRTYPEARIDYMLYDDIAPLFRNHPDIDNLITLSAEERRRPLCYLRKILAIRRTGYDIVLDLKTLPSGCFATLLSGAGETVGYDRPRSRSWIYRKRVPREIHGTSTIEKRLRVLQALDGPIRIDTRIALFLQDEEIDRMRDRMTAAGVDPERPVLLFHVTSSRQRKTWPVDCFVEVIKHSMARYDAQIVLIYGPGERAYVDDTVRMLPDRRDVFSDIQTAGLRELAALIKTCDLFVGNDSGPRHIAEAVGIPTIAIFAPGSSKLTWMPNQNEKHQGIDLSDVPGLEVANLFENLPHIRENLERYYRLITPALVAERIDTMLPRLLRERNKKLSGFPGNSRPG